VEVGTPAGHSKDGRSSRMSENIPEANLRIREFVGDGDLVYTDFSREGAPPEPPLDPLVSRFDRRPWGEYFLQALKSVILAPQRSRPSAKQTTIRKPFCKPRT